MGMLGHATAIGRLRACRGSLADDDAHRHDADWRAARRVAALVGMHAYASPQTHVDKAPRAATNNATGTIGAAMRRCRDVTGLSGIISQQPAPILI